MLANWPCPIIFGHRGASAHAPENTLAAFRLAAAQGADAIELDARLTSDGQVAILHDPTLDRTTDGHGPLSRLTLAEARRLDAGSHFCPEYQGERIPTLEEVFAELGETLRINVELVNYQNQTDRLPLACADLVSKYRLEERVIFSSFNPLNLFRVRRKLPEVAVGLLTLPGQAARSWPWLLLRLLPGAALHPHLDDVSPDLLRKAHRIGRRVHVWTVNDPADMRRLFGWGVDGIFTDDPALARQALEKAP